MSEQPLKANENDEIKAPKQKVNGINAEYDNFYLRVKYVFSIANDNEFNAATSLVKAPDIEGDNGQEKLTNISEGVYIGMVENHPVGLILHGTGRDSQRLLNNGLQLFPNAKHVVAVGICYGFESNNKKPQLGDVLISDRIIDLGSFKVTAERIISRGDDVRMRDEIYSVFCRRPNQETDFKVATSRSAKHIVGAFVSGTLLVNDPGMKKKIEEEVRQEACGGEMEGGELLRLQRDGITMPNGDQKRDVQVIVIKAVSDLGDGLKKDNWQFIGAQAAFHYATIKMKEQSDQVKAVLLEEEEVKQFITDMEQPKNTRNGGAVATTTRPPQTDSGAPSLNLASLKLLQCGNKEIRIIDGVGTNWKTVGDLIGLPHYRTAAIEKVRQLDPNECCRDVFSDWLEGKGKENYPASWDGLQKLLKDIQLSTLAKDVQKALTY